MVNSQEDARAVGLWIVMGCSVEPRVELALRRTLFFSLFIFFYLIFGASVFSLIPRRHLPSVSLSCIGLVEFLQRKRCSEMDIKATSEETFKIWNGTKENQWPSVNCEGGV